MPRSVKKVMRLAGPGTVDPADPVVVADADAGDVGERLLPLGPAVAGDDDPGILVDDVVFLAELHGGRGRRRSWFAGARRRSWRSASARPR